jgi:hypothetical protein
MSYTAPGDHHAKMRSLLRLLESGARLETFGPIA